MFIESELHPDIRWVEYHGVQYWQMSHERSTCPGRCTSWGAPLQRHSHLHVAKWRSDIGD